MPTAIVVDGAYFLRRFSSRFPHLDAHNASHAVGGLSWLTRFHVAQVIHRDSALRDSPNFDRDITLGEAQTSALWVEFRELYRIFFYDCPPLSKRVHLPISKRAFDFSRTETAIVRNAIHRELSSARKVALRLGRLNDTVGWRVKSEATERWIREAGPVSPKDSDFEIDTVQKGVDMRLGLDVASMAFKKQIDQLILVAGDADFVPAAKLARREGIDVVLDPMGGTPAQDLVANVDGVRNAPRANLRP